MTSLEVIVHQCDRQRAILRRNRIPYFSHASLAIDKIYHLVGVEFRKILRVEQWGSFAVQQLDFRHTLRREARLENIVILIGKRPEVADADGNLLRRRFSRPGRFRFVPWAPLALA
jgi:hypothetical protein